MEKALMRAEGYTGEVELLESKIRIKKKGGFLDVVLRGADAKGQIRGDKDILFKEISAVEFKKATWAAPGYIRFMFKGGQETKSRSFKDLKKDGNAVMFRPNQSSAFEKMKEAIDKKMALMEEDGTKTSDLDDLEKLAALRDKGIITEEEFNAKKKQLLGL